MVDPVVLKEWDAEDFPVERPEDSERRAHVLVACYVNLRCEYGEFCMVSDCPRSYEDALRGFLRDSQDSEWPSWAKWDDLEAVRADLDPQYSFEAFDHQLDLAGVTDERYLFTLRRWLRPSK